MTQTTKKRNQRAGRILSDDGRHFMWRDSLYSNSREYDPMKRKSIAGGVITSSRKSAGVVE